MTAARPRQGTLSACGRQHHPV